MPAEPSNACIALGSNLGERRATIRAGLSQIGLLRGTSVQAVSSCIETDPVGPIAQPRYLNAAAVIHTVLPPREFLAALLDIERSLGRDRARQERWGPRTLDLDLLLYDDLVFSEPGLTIPHPRLHERLFVLIPLAEIAPTRIVPILGATISELRNRLDPQSVQSLPELGHS